MLERYKASGLDELPDKTLIPVKGRFQYPFAEMKVGDYFLMVLQTHARSAWVASQHLSKVHPGKRFAKVRVEEGWRIYRTA